ncbi:MAG: N-6 DNA methylase [Prevotellaceae bacterium]|jgi:type I restriction-modification system DNA methylase subunit|nr:N-6 DNA methylase [Prevotellaceae bacterium]
MNGQKNILAQLQALEMIPNRSGLRLVSDMESADISEAERRMLHIAGRNYLADAVYFRKFDYRAPIQQIFIYDNTAGRLSESDKKDIHKRIWTSEIVPVYYIFEKTELLVVNGKKNMLIEDGKESLDRVVEALNFARDIEQSYDARKHPYKAYFFDTGAFWETEAYLQRFITNDSPFNLLIGYLKELKRLISADVSENVLNKLIVRCLLVKYLEEKRDESGKNIFTVKSNLLKERWNVADFVGVIKSGKLLDLFDYLAGYYNGKIFQWDNSDERNEIAHLSQKVLGFLAAYFDGNTNFKKSGQLSIWRYYSFQYLPVELISRIYEEFLPNKSGVVYTPPYLVNYLVDECMPIEDYKKFEAEQFKILDPSLGSGIFCVSAYKRLIDWYRINRWYKEGVSWEQPVGSDKLKSILKQNIYGTDVEAEAVRIAIFSLTLALLENLTPMQILEELRFDDLSKENILHENFFGFFNRHERQPDFDLIIGNPPFNPPDRRSNGEYFDFLKKEYKTKASHDIPDSNLALVFLDRAVRLCKPDEGLTCLILPSAPVLYGQWSTEYRSHFLRSYAVPQIVDFTHLRRILFNRDVSTLALFAHNRAPEANSRILHIVANRTQKEQNRLFFLFDRYDFHFVAYQRALAEKHAWKTNLLGGGRLGSIAERFAGVKPTLKEYIDSKRSEGWEYGEGYVKGNTAGKTQEQIKKQLSKADWLFEKPSVISNSFSEDGSYSTEVHAGVEYFLNPVKENKNIFNPPHLIIRENLGLHNIPVLYRKQGEPLIFRHQLVGIHGNNEGELQDIFDFIKNTHCNLCRFYTYLTSTRLLIDKETSVLKADIDALPYPEDKSVLRLNEIEEIWCADVLQYYIHQAKSPDKNPLNKLVDNPEVQVKSYGEVFCKVMNASYRHKPEHSFKQGASFETSSFMATCFHYTDQPISFSFDKKTERDFKEYFNRQTGSNQLIMRIVKCYCGNTIWLIKPRLVRYWLKSIADRDAIDCINEILTNQ